jgi:hypothetical protein
MRLGWRLAGLVISRVTARGVVTRAMTRELAVARAIAAMSI